jgi:23S rRNA pseudouridine2605 synthase
MQERLQKIIASAGIVSRRKAEELIQAGQVSVNGVIVTTLGVKADPEHDHIKVAGKLVRHVPTRVYILLNKPRQVISTVSDPQKRTKVTDLVRVKERIYPVGRLDYNTEGLILLTNDGDFARIVTRAGSHMAKVYRVKVRSVPGEPALDRLRKGVRLKDGTRLAPARIRLLKEGNNSWLEVTLTEGKNRQIRQMFELIGHPVSKIRRIRIGFLTDHGLDPGEYRFLAASEVTRILKLGRASVEQPQGREEE